MKVATATATGPASVKYLKRTTQNRKLQCSGGDE